MRRGSLSRQLAEQRLLDTSTEAVERLERSIAGTIEVSAFKEAKRLLRYRLLLSERVDDSPDARKTLAELSDNLDRAIADPRGAERGRAR